MNLFETLVDRNLLYQSTDVELLKKMLANEKVTVYTGTDPTMDSLHIGHCVPCTILRRFQQAGHKVIILVGGATAAIGDPTGKTDMRPMLTKEQLNHNIEGIKRALSRFARFSFSTRGGYQFHAAFPFSDDQLAPCFNPFLIADRFRQINTERRADSMHGNSRSPKTKFYRFVLTRNSISTVPVFALCLCPVFAFFVVASHCLISPFITFSG